MLLCVNAPSCVLRAELHTGTLGCLQIAQECIWSRYEDKYMDRLSERLEELIGMQGTQAQLAGLLPANQSMRAVSML